MATIGEALSADPVPRARREATALSEDVRGGFGTDVGTAEVARLIIRPRGIGKPNDVPPRLVVQAAIDLLPFWARTLHGLAVMTERLDWNRCGLPQRLQALSAILKRRQSFAIASTCLGPRRLQLDR